MPASRFRQVLVVDDEENIRRLLATILQKEGMEVCCASDGEQALRALSQRSFDLILSDIRMPGMSGLDLLERLRTEQPDAVVLMMSAYGSVDTAIAAIQRGAYDYIAKPFKPVEAVLMIRKAEERERLKWENQRLRSDLERIKAAGFGRIVTRNPAMQKILRTVAKIADYKTTVLIQGESGTGKELVARALHESSSRKAEPFVAVNCGAIPENLLESELFGHRRGAFTDATRDKRGLFEEADGGTLFLDEVGELPANLQVKLLRVLQEGEFRRVGDEKSTAVDVRVVAATIKDLDHESRAGRFRQDLFYRLNVMPLHLPPLRERPEDVPLLVEHAICSHNERLKLAVKRASPETMKALLAHGWPGNVRELENTVEHAMVLAEGDRIEADDLPAKVLDTTDPVQQTLRRGSLSIKKNSRIIEEELIRRALEKTGGNRTSASKILEISHRALLYKIKAYGIGDA
jgi:two-component system response regulator AtoC